MASHGGGNRLRQPSNTHSNDHGYIFSLSTNLIRGWSRLFSYLSPYVSNSNRGQLARINSRRIHTDTHDVEENLHSLPVMSPSWERQRQPNPSMMAHWSTDDVHLTEEGNITSINSSGSSVTTHQASRLHDNVVINMELSRPVSSRSSEDSADRVLAGDHEETIENHNSSNNSETGATNDENVQQTEDNGHSVRINGESISELLERYPEVRDLLKALWQYCVFLLIIFAKIIFDRFTSLLVLLLFWFTFVVSNKIVKRILALPERLSPRSALELLSMFAVIPSVVYLFYHYSSSNLYYSAVLLPSDYNFRTLGDLLWIVIVTDYVIKLITVIIKGFYAASSCLCVRHKQRGKHLALVEITSQLYRSLAPIQPWLSFLLDNYTGIQKVFGVFLSAVYMLCKGPDIIYRVKNFLFVFRKFLEELNYGSAPSKTQLKDTGNTCPICQDDFVIPTMLQCKHIFCEECVARWFDRERTCPMCRTKIADDPTYRDGATSHSIQLY